MNAVTTTEANAVQTIPPSEAGALMEVITRAARDPSIDVDKLERLMAMHERIAGKNAEVAFNEAMSHAQAKMRPISADATNPQTRSKYATYAKLDGALRPIYTDEGFALSFDTGDAPSSDQVRVLCYVSHRAGHSRTYKLDMPADGKGAKGGDVMTKTHAMGAGMSYGMRYLLKGIFNVAVGEDDNDGNEPADPVIGQVLADLVKRVRQTKTDAEALAFWKDHNAAFRGERRAFEEFKAQTAAHRVELKEAAGDAE